MSSQLKNDESMRIIFGLPYNQEIVTPSSEKKYGFAHTNSKLGRWHFDVGSFIYVLGIYQGTFRTYELMEDLLDYEPEYSAYALLELDANLKPTKLINHFLMIEPLKSQTNENHGEDSKCNSVIRDNLIIFGNVPPMGDFEY
jgi:hypothetical protein